MKDQRHEIDWSAPAGQSAKYKKDKRKKRARGKRIFLRILLTMAGTAAAFCACALLYWHHDSLSATSDATINSEEVRQSALRRKLNIPSKSISRIPVFAHRGFSEDSLKNSFEAYDLALNSGCPQIELDVRTSSDGVLYVSHDENLSKISNSDWEIGRHTSEELDQIVMTNGEKLHRLSEVFARYRDQMIYLVEFKDDNPDPQPFLSVMHEFPNYAENVQIQSFYPEILENIHQQLPNMFVQLLIENESDISQALSYDWLDSLAIDQKLVSPDVISSIQNTDREVWVWTVDDIDKVHEYLSMGVNGVITDLDSAVVIYKELSAG